jgi:hypothetical protein
MSRLGPAAEELVAVWRRSLTAHDEFLRDDLDELEAHVRTGVAARVADGVSEAEAFADAVGDLGPPAGIAEEFGKADPSRVWRCRLRRMLVGPLVGEVVLLAAMYGGLVARGTANWFWRPVGEVPRSLYSVFAVVVFTLLLGALSAYRALGWLRRARRLLVGGAGSPRVHEPWRSPALSSLWGCSSARRSSCIVLIG